MICLPCCLRRNLFESGAGGNRTRDPLLAKPKHVIPQSHEWSNAAGDQEGKDAALCQTDSVERRRGRG
jgi:hypothetical protein